MARTRPRRVSRSRSRQPVASRGACRRASSRREGQGPAPRWRGLTRRDGDGAPDHRGHGRDRDLPGRAHHAAAIRRDARWAARSRRRRSIVNVRDPINPPPVVLVAARLDDSHGGASLDSLSSASRWTTRWTCCSTRRRATDSAATHVLSPRDGVGARLRRRDPARPAAWPPVLRDAELPARARSRSFPGASPSRRRC